MYLRIVTSNAFGTRDIFVGPFSSQKERAQIKKELLELLGKPIAIAIYLDKLPKNTSAYEPKYIKAFLESLGNS